MNSQLPSPLARPLAQTLPCDIIAHIAQYVKLGAATPKALVRGSTTIPMTSRELVPLTAVCRDWRTVVNPIIYQVACLCTSDYKPYRLSDDCLSALNRAVQHRKQGLIRQLYLFVDMSTLFELEGLDSFLQFALSECGELVNVNKLVLVPTYSNSPYRWGSNNALEKIEKAADISTTMDCLLKGIRCLVPNVRVVNTTYQSQYGHHYGRIRDNEHAMALLPAMFASQTTQVSTDLVKLSRVQLSQFVPGLLRSISISNCKGPQIPIEFIRRHAPWLESLSISNFTTLAIIKLTLGATPESTCMYPRLKKLYIASVVGFRRERFRQPLADPFPALEVLDCQSSFPFSTLVVLEGGRSHFRVLRMRLDEDLFGKMEQNGLLRKAAFQKLQVVSLKWVERSVHDLQAYSERMMLKSLEIGAQTQIVHVNKLRTVDFDLTIPKLHFASTIRVLDFQETAMTISQAATLLCGFPNLFKTMLFLRESPELRSKRMPEPEEITQFRKKFIDCRSSVQFVDVCKTQFANTRRAGEYIVLFADVLPSVSKVRIACTNSGRSDRVLKGANFALARTIYRGSHAQDVRLYKD
ncbi:hypothetical protein GGI04_000881 [Coemansia thaxteri]|uniref:F-box domain-containing protein n=1 Tax=Coemansia thaxteri TaxID=2663907 RepID=A0A9W8EL91_9FUNG|nr:hypothetical protein H4R26_001335 [Coemansia thaxteri]KAJ2008918.1 hypothetical protein GGI04_000881 [Coemansia thaxteri]KAJ2473534.1 hypothetical protein GGI02_000789 [Coemansia sp. RSA 2322]KAJ2487911.1 hypothetical protein EV174_000258 [Coemansia sp. RSA 2320]